MTRLRNNLLTMFGAVGMLAMALLAMTSVAAVAPDLHWLWHDRCAGCHGHAAEFARKSLNVSGEQLTGRHHENNLWLFLHNHYLSGHEVDAVYDMLFAQVKTQARFKDECSICHGIAAEFVRNSLELRDGVLHGRESGSPARVFLTSHRDMTAEDVDYFNSLLERLAREIYRP
jgi:hypothetical protein